MATKEDWEALDAANAERVKLGDSPCCLCGYHECLPCAKERLEFDFKQEHGTDLLSNKAGPLPPSRTALVLGGIVAYPSKHMKELDGFFTTDT